MAWDGSWKGVKKGITNTTGVKSSDIDAAATVLAPVAAGNQYVAGGQIKKDANTFAGDLKKRDEGYQVQAPPPVAVPRPLDPNIKAVTMNMPEALRPTTITTVNDPAAPDFSQSAGAVGFQGGLASDLALASRGQGPSLASEQLKQANAANLAATYSMMASQRGGPTAAGARVGMQTAADLNAKSAQDAAMARIKEQTDARAQLGQVTSQMRQGDVAEVGLKTQVALDTYKGQLQQAVAQGQISAGEASQQFAVAADRERTNANLAVEHNKRIDDYVRMGLSVEQANQRAAIDLEQIRAGVKKGPTVGSQILSGIGQMAGPAATVFGGPAAGVAAGTAANALRPAAEDYTAADAEPSTGINANRYSDTTSYRQQ